MEFGIPFDVDPKSAVPDEYEVTAAEERMRIGAKVTDGVYPQVRIVKDNILEPQAYIGESLRVSAGVGLSVAVSAGMACVGSTDYFNTETKAIHFEKNNIEQVWDIVVELDLVNQKALTKKQMRASGMKITDALIRTKHLHQICLATVTIPPNTEEIVTANIEEQRLNTALATDGKPVCGIVGSVMQADTRMISEALNQQIKENDVKFCKALERYNGQIVKNQQDYEEWFTNVKIELGKDAAGNLLNKINEVQTTTYTKTQTTTLINKNTGINATATHSNNVVAITAPTDAVQIIFEAPSNFAEADTYTLNGAPLTLTDLNNEPLSDAWKQGATVPLIIKDGKAFFKGGGGSYGTLSPQIKQFTAKAGNHQITLNWQNPSDANHAGTYLVRKQGSKPTKLSDGTKIDVGKATAYTDNEPENDKLYYYRAFPYNAKKQVQTELTGAVVSATPKAFSLPKYTGQHAIFGDETKGRIEMYSSGTLTLDTENYDLFAVGGGVGGWADTGSGSGYTKTKLSVILSNSINVQVAAECPEGVGKGNSTSIGDIITANGGDGINGGSGGGGVDTKNNVAGDGGSNGSDGEDSSYSNGGIGQHTTTRAFEESDGTLYAGGGGGCNGGKGGAGGGGDGADIYRVDPKSGTPNTGGGAGGIRHVKHKPTGGSGIAIIRWGY